MSPGERALDTACDIDFDHEMVWRIDRLLQAIARDDRHPAETACSRIPPLNRKPMLQSLASVERVGNLVLLGRKDNKPRVVQPDRKGIKQGGHGIDIKPFNGLAGYMRDAQG